MNANEKVNKTPLKSPASKGKSPTNLLHLIRTYVDSEARYLDEATDECVLFADLVGSTAYKQHHGPIIGMIKTLHHNDIARSQVNTSDGLVVKYLGDGLLARFRGNGAAKSAITAGINIIRAMDEHNAKRELSFPDTLSTRIGIHFGPVWLFPSLDEEERNDEEKRNDDEERITDLVLDPYGSTVDIAARLCDVADVQQLVCSQEAFESAGGTTAFPGAGEETRRFLKGVNKPQSMREIPLPGKECRKLRLVGHRRGVLEPVQIKLDHACALLRKNDHLDAILEFKKILDDDPGNFDANYRFAEILIKRIPRNVGALGNAKTKKFEKASTDLGFNILDPVARLDAALGHLCDAKQIREEACQIWLLLSLLHFTRYELTGETDHLLEAMERSEDAMRRASEFLDTEAEILSRTYLAMFLNECARREHDPEKREEHLARAEELCMNIQSRYDHFVETSRSQYLATHAETKIERGQAESQESVIKGMISAAKEADPSNVRIFDVEKRLVQELSETSGGHALII